MNMHTTHTVNRQHLTALVQVGPVQITVELSDGIRVGDPDWAPKVAKEIAAGLESAYSYTPIKGSV